MIANLMRIYSADGTQQLGNLLVAIIPKPTYVLRSDNVLKLDSAVLLSELKNLAQSHTSIEFNLHKRPLRKLGIWGDGDPHSRDLLDRADRNCISIQSLQSCAYAAE